MTQLTPITSSMLSAIGYDADTLTLFVQFNPSKKQQAAEVAGDLWAYSAVIPERYEEMAAAESVGKYFLANIKGKYTGEMVVPEMLPTDGATTRETTHYGETPMEEEW